MAVARAAIDAGEFETARRVLAELTGERPTQRACLLMAELAAKEHGDHGRAREWMARALRAARDPAWTADGQASDVWLPASLVTGRLDAFEWKVPVAEIGGPVLQVDDVLADHHEAEQPATVAAQIIEVMAAPVAEEPPAPPSPPPAIAVEEPAPPRLPEPRPPPRSRRSRRWSIFPARGHSRWKRCFPSPGRRMIRDRSSRPRRGAPRSSGADGGGACDNGVLPPAPRP